MTITYTWHITNLKKQNNPSIELDDIIVQTYWYCTGTDENNNSGTFYGATPFDPNQIDPNNFTAFEDLTEEQVLGWVQETVNNNEAYNAHIEEQIQNQIDVLVNPVTEASGEDLPWVESISPPEA